MPFRPWRNRRTRQVAPRRHLQVLYWLQLGSLASLRQGQWAEPRARRPFSALRLRQRQSRLHLRSFCRQHPQAFPCNHPWARRSVRPCHLVRPFGPVEANKRPRQSPRARPSQQSPTRRSSWAIRSPLRHNHQRFRAKADDHCRRGSVHHCRGPSRHVPNHCMLPITACCQSLHVVRGFNPHQPQSIPQDLPDIMRHEKPCAGNFRILNQYKALVRLVIT